MKNAPTIMITGARGFVGARAMEHYRNAIPVPSELLRNAGEPLAEFVRARRPDVILNAAAISDIGDCAKDPEGSYAANVELPALLAKVSRETGAKLLSFSSDQVYTGCADEGPYSESDILPQPANLYARHKLEAEERVLDILPEAILLRATWMYDMPAQNHVNRGNFLINTLAAALHGRRMRCSSREYRGLTYVRQVVGLMDQMIKLPGGVYNYGSENPLNMLDTTLALLSELGLDRAKPLVEDTAGQRGHNLWMNCEKLRKNGVFFDTTAEGFARCARDYSLRW